MVRRWLPAVGVGVIAFVAIRLALLPGLGFWDTAELQTVAPLLGTAHPTGFPTYVILGWIASIVLQPLGEPAFAMNLFAALSVAVAAGVTVDLVRALTGSVALGAAAGIGLALTEIAWRIGTHAEAHALHLALLAILVRLLIAWEDRAAGDGDRTLIAAAVVFALSMGNHSLTLLLAPGVGLFVLAVDPGLLRQPRRIVTPAIALLTTLVLVYAQLPLRAGPFRADLVYGRPDTWDGFWAIVLAEQFRGSLSAPFSDLAGKVADLADLAARWWGPLAVLIPVGLLAAGLRRPRYLLLSGVSVLITCFFAAAYANAAIERYYLGPVFFAWTWLAILAGTLLDAARGRLQATASERAWQGGSLASATLAVILAGVLLVPTAADAQARFARVDRSDDQEARRWVQRVLAEMAPNAVIVSWWSYSTPLWYAQRVEGQRPDIAIIDDRTRLDEDLGSLTDVIDANLPIRPVYVIRLDRQEIGLLEDRYVLETIDGADATALTRVVAVREAAP